MRKIKASALGRVFSVAVFLVVANKKRIAPGFYIYTTLETFYFLCLCYF